MTAKPASSASKAAALTTPQIDFWLVGGLSLLFMAAMYWAKVANISLPQYQLGWWAYYASFAINYPHFAHSYQLFYGGFPARLADKTAPLSARARMMVAGVLVPLVLAVYFSYTWAVQSPALMGYGVAAMYFFVGWHYVKQGYGALITFSVYKKIYYEDWEKQILYTNAYAVWLYTWSKLNIPVVTQPFLDVSYQTAGVPDWIVAGLLAVLIVTSLLSAFVLLRAWLVGKRGISLNGLTGYVCGSYVWVTFAYFHPVYLLFVPLFHSLQYLPFVWRYKSREILGKAAGEEADAPAPRRRWLIGLGLFVAMGVLLGGAFMDWLPRQADKLIAADGFTRSFILIAALLFINIHHYFIDNAFWRRDNRRVQDYLFKS